LRKNLLDCSINLTNGICAEAETLIDDASVTVDDIGSGDSAFSEERCGPDLGELHQAQRAGAPGLDSQTRDRASPNSTVLFCCFAENYPPPAHNKNSEPMSNSAHIVIHRTPHPAQVFVAQRKSSAMALFARIIPSPQLRKAMQTTRFFRGRINRNPFRSKDFRVIVLAMVNFHRFPNLQGSPLHQFPNFLWFAALSFLTFDSEFYPSLRNASI
jgi:hypothetical protein